MKKRNLASTAEQKELMIKALEATYSNVRMSVKIADISAQTHYRWLKEDSAYELQAETSRDVGYRNMKDNLIELAMVKAIKGDTAVLNKLLGIFLKDMPEEMKTLNRYNKVPFRASIKYVDKPTDPNNTYYRNPGSIGLSEKD